MPGELATYQMAQIPERINLNILQAQYVFGMKMLPHLVTASAALSLTAKDDYIFQGKFSACPVTLCKLHQHAEK